MKSTDRVRTARNFCFAQLIGAAVLCWAISPSKLQASAQYRFEPDDCSAFSGKDWYGNARVHCGQLLVAEAGMTEPFALAVLRIDGAPKGNDPAPVVFVSGGPGANGLAGVEDWAQHPLLETHDLILLNARGTGSSSPAICPDLSKNILQVLSQDLSLADELAQRSDAAKLCLESLPFAADAGFLSSSAMAADIEAMRSLLGFEQINLYAVSYGSRVAMSYADAYPKRLASLVLDSVVPADRGYYEEIPKNFQRALDMLFGDCKDSPTCSEKYPNLRQDFEDLMLRLDRSPMEITLSFDTQGLPKKFFVNDQDFRFLVHQLMYGKEYLSIIPLLIDELKHDRSASLPFMFEVVIGMRAEAINLATYYLVLARDEMSADDVASSAPAPLSRKRSGIAVFDTDLNVLRSLRPQLGQPDPLRLAKLPDVPTLVMAARYDPIAAPSYGKQIASGIDGASFFEFPATGHGASFAEPCARELIATYLANPAAQLKKPACMDLHRRPQFSVSLYRSPGLRELARSMFRERSGATLIWPMGFFAIFAASACWVVFAILVARLRRHRVSTTAMAMPGSRPIALTIAGSVLGASLLLGMAIVMFSVASGSEPTSLIFGLPKISAYVLILNALSLSVLTLLMIVRATSAWRTWSWSTPVRLLFTLLTAANAGLLIFVCYWQLLWPGQ